MRSSFLICAVAGGGVAILNYFQGSKKEAKASWTTNYTPEKWDNNWDKREPCSRVKPKRKSSDSNKENVLVDESQAVLPTANRHLLFIRHGQYNLKGKTDVENKLTLLGRSQADLTGIRLKELDFKYTRIVQSTMTRAKETTALIRKHLSMDIPVESCAMLVEGAPVPPEPAFGNWRPEAQQFFEDGARIEAAFRKYFYRADPEQKVDSHEIFVGHANVIRFFICRALQVPYEAWGRFTLRHCSITWLTIRPSGRVVVYSIGDSGHIPPDKISTS